MFSKHQIQRQSLILQSLAKTKEFLKTLVTGAVLSKCYGELCLSVKSVFNQLILEMGSGAIFDPRQMKRVIIF